MQNFWGFDVWGSFNVFSVLLITLLVANMLKKNIKFLRVSLIPTSVLGGLLLIVVAGIFKAFTGEIMFDSAFFGGNGTITLETLTYHTLALGFIAGSFKASKGKLSKQRTVEIFNTGVTTVSTYLLQAVVGFGITILATLFFMKDFFPAAGVLLPFGYGQGTGQAMNYGTIYETDFGFDDGKSFGLTIAALGFLSASIGGVIHLNVLRKQGKLGTQNVEEGVIRTEDIQSANEIPMQESIDKMTIQIALIALAYMLAYLLMHFLGMLLPGMRSVIFGFNFLLGVLTATLIKAIMNFLMRKNVIKKEYTNDFLMTRASNFFYDIMVIAGMAAIRLSALEKYWGIMLIIGVSGLLVTYIYNRIVARTLFKHYEQEQFLAMYGMLTGTASTGIILLREIDGEFKSPASDNLVYQNFPAIVFGFPMMLLATMAPTRPYLTFAILAAFFLVMNLILFRSKIFRKKSK